MCFWVGTRWGLKKMKNKIFLFMVVGILMIGVTSATWTSVHKDNGQQFCTGLTAVSSGGCSVSECCGAESRLGGNNGNGWGCDGYTKMGCDDDGAGPTYKTCELESNSAVCGYVACSYSLWVNSSNYRCASNTLERNQTRSKTAGSGTCSDVQRWVTVQNCASTSTVCDVASYTCKAPFNLNTTYWANMNGTKISSANNGDTVLMVYGGYGLEGKTIDYVVQQYNSSFVWYQPSTWFSKSWNDANKISGNAYQVWSVPLLNLYTKRFNATTGSASNISGNLTITEAASDNNFEPVFGLNTHPGNLSIVSVNASTRFRKEVMDLDDLLQITWDFGDGTSATFYNYSYYLNSTSADAFHNYTKPGVYYWTVTAKEMNRMHSVSQTRIIYVVQNGINVIPEISSPERGSAVGTAWITFNASKTFVANCTTGVMANRNFTTNDSLLNCSYLHVPGSRIYQNLSGYYLTFNWNMGDGKTIVKNWTAADYNSSIEFFYKYDSSGTHYITLGVDYGLK